MPYGTTIGATGGSADAVVVSHTHTAGSSVTDPGHNHYTTVLQTSKSGNATPYILSNSENLNGPTNLYTSVSSTGISVSTSINSAGSSGTGANLPPYLGINFIIKT
jgi:microcystin-dependent protein